MTGWHVVELAVGCWLGGNAALVGLMCALKPRPSVSLVSLVRPIVPAARKVDAV